MSMEFAIMGECYPSISAAAKALGISPGLLSKRIHTGCDLDRITVIPKRTGHSTKPIAIIINGKYFSSISEAARYYNMPACSLGIELKRAMDGNKTLFATPRKRVFRKGNQITIQGVTYNSWAEAAHDLGINYQTFVDRVKTGYYGGKPRPKTIYHGTSTPVWVNGVKYPSHAECARANGLTPSTLAHRISCGISIDVAIDPVKFAEAWEKVVKQREIDRLARLHEKHERIRKEKEAKERCDDFVKHGDIIEEYPTSECSISETVDW